MSWGEVRFQLQGMLQGRDSTAVIMALHVGLAQVDKAGGQRGIEFSYLAELGNSHGNISLLVGLDTRLQMPQRLRGGRLRGQPQAKGQVDHGCSGSRTSKNWSA